MHMHTPLANCVAQSNSCPVSNLSRNNVAIMSSKSITHHVHGMNQSSVWTLRRFNVKSRDMRCVFVLYFTSAQLSETRREQPRSLQQSQVRHVNVSIGACAALWLSGGPPVNHNALVTLNSPEHPRPRDRRGDILRDKKEDERQKYMATCWSLRSHKNETKVKT